MNMPIHYLVFLSFTSSVAFTDTTVNMPSDNAHWTPLPQMEIGKVKRLSKDQLPLDMKKFAEDEIAKSKKGNDTIPEEFFTASAGYHNRLRSEDEVKPKLKVTLADINSTELKDYVYEGIIPDGPTINGPWTSVIRVFKRQDGVTVMLREWDYVADGGAIVTINELMNVKVASEPAMLTVKKSPSGKTVTELDWSTDTKQFTLTVWDDVDTKHKGKAYDRKWLVNLANSIS